MQAILLTVTKAPDGICSVDQSNFILAVHTKTALQLVAIPGAVNGGE